MRDNEPTEEDWADYGEWCRMMDEMQFYRMAAEMSEIETFIKEGED